MDAGLIVVAFFGSSLAEALRTGFRVYNVSRRIIKKGEAR